MDVTPYVFNALLSLQSTTCEQGGVLGGKNGIITHFYLDNGAERNSFYYKPNVQALNEVIENWYNDGIDFLGLAHSHPKGKALLSASDISFAEQLIKSNRLQKCHFPLTAMKNEKWVIKAFTYDGTWQLEDVNVLSNN